MYFSSNIWHSNDFRNLWTEKESREGGNVMDMMRFGCFAISAYLALLYSICWPSVIHVSLILYFLSSISVLQHKPIITVQPSLAEWESQQLELHCVPLTDLERLLFSSQSPLSTHALQTLNITSRRSETSGPFSWDVNSQAGIIAVFFF